MSDKVLHTLLFLPARLDYKFAVGNRGKFRFGKNDTHTNRWDNILEIKQELLWYKQLKFSNWADFKMSQSSLAIQTDVSLAGYEARTI